MVKSVPIDFRKGKRKDWKEWEGKKLIRLGYWPQYKDWQKDWVHFDAKKIVADLVEGKIDVLEWGVPENWVYYVDIVSVKKHPALRKLKYDPLKKLIDECKKHNIKFIAGLLPDMLWESSKDFFKKHKNSLKKALIFSKDGIGPPFSYFCFNMPLAKKLVVKHLTKIAEKYAINAFKKTFTNPDQAIPDVCEDEFVIEIFGRENTVVTTRPDVNVVSSTDQVAVEVRSD